MAACALLLLVVAARAEPRPVWHKSDALEELWRYVELLGGDLVRGLRPWQTRWLCAACRASSHHACD